MDKNKLTEYEPFWNNWYIDSLIGEGSYGSVYKIVREEFGEKYYSALKIISIPKSQNEVKRLLFEGLNEDEARLYFKEIAEDIYKEITVMNKLKGKTNIVNCEDHQVIQRKDEIGYDIFIRMELLQGLNDYAVSHTFSSEEVIRMGKEICQALILCQKHNIMHRDIKPENIFISKDGDYKLGDFGIARKEEKTECGLSIKGSYEYMAPEVYLGKDYDSRVDIYSLGVVLYTFLNCNKTPFLPVKSHGTNRSERKEALRERFEGKEIPNPTLASGALSRIILKAIAYKPEDRYATAQEFYKALSWLKSEDLEQDNPVELTASSLSNKKIECIKTKNTNKLDNKNIIRIILVSIFLVGGITGLSLVALKLKNAGNEEPTQVVVQETIKPTAELTIEPTIEPTVEPTLEPTPEPTPMISVEPTEIVISNQKVKEIPNLDSLGMVTTLDISNNRISNISLLENSIYMENLSVNNNKIDDINAITNMNHLIYLDGSNNKIEDITPLKNLEKLSVLVLSNNQIKDITALSNLQELTVLHLDGNAIRKIHLLSNLKNLVFLNLSGNEVSDFSPLFDLEKLEFLIVTDTKISDEQLKRLKKELPNCEIQN